MVPVAVGVLAAAAFALEGMAYATWAMERSPDCRGEPSLECAVTVVLDPLVAVTGGVVAGVGVGVAMAFYARGRTRRAIVTAVAALAVLAVVHLLLLVF